MTIDASRSATPASPRRRTVLKGFAGAATLAGVGGNALAQAAAVQRRRAPRKAATAGVAPVVAPKLAKTPARAPKPLAKPRLRSATPRASSAGTPRRKSPPG